MKKKLIIFGNNVMAKMMNFCFSQSSEYEVVAFCVHKKYITESTFCSLNVYDFETVQERFSPNEYEMFVAIGPSRMNRNRENVYKEAKAKGYRCASYISPKAICHSSPGENSFVSDKVIIHPFVKLGENNYFWDNSFISHDSVIGSHCYFSPGSIVSTYADIGDNSIVGTAAVINTNIKIATGTLVGATCYISQNTVENGVYGEKTSIFYGPISDKVNI